MTLSYRSAQAADRETVFDLYRTVMLPLISEIWGWDEAWQRADFDTHFAPEGLRLVYDQDALVAYAQTETRDRQLYVRMLVVDAAYRRRGIGRALLVQIIDDAGDAFDEIGLEVFRINDPARSFYETFGFECVAETASSHVMVLRLSPDTR